MILTPYDINKIATKGYVKTCNHRLFDKFVKSGQPCVKVENYHHKNAYTCYASLRKSAERFEQKNIKVILRKREVYLVRKDMLDS